MEETISSCIGSFTKGEKLGSCDCVDVFDEVLEAYRMKKREGAISKVNSEKRMITWIGIFFFEEVLEEKGFKDRWRHEGNVLGDVWRWPNLNFVNENPRGRIW